VARCSYCHVYVCLQTGFGLDTGFIDRNYSIHKAFSSQPDFQLSTLATNWLPQTVPVITSRYVPHGKHRSVVAVPLLRSCLLGLPRDRYSAHWWLPSSGCLSCLFRSSCLATGPYATISNVMKICQFVQMHMNT
jgi:hypothetical protein